MLKTCHKLSDSFQWEKTNENSERKSGNPELDRIKRFFLKLCRIC